MVAFGGIWSMRALVVLLAACVPAALFRRIGHSPQAVADAPARAARIVVGPNVRVSEDDFPHVETWIATNPRDSLHLTGSAIVAHPSVGFHSRTYTSRDGGQRWRASGPAEELEDGSSDPMVAVGVTGTVYLATIGVRGLRLYRSEDQGRSWRPPLVLGHRMDHEAITVDRTGGRHHGRVYVVGEWTADTARRGVYVAHSDDDGRTFSPFVRACHRPGWNAATMSAFVLGDGALVVSCLPYPRYPERWEWRGGDFGFVRSTDGGATFSPFQPVAHIGRPTPREALRASWGDNTITKGNDHPVFAVDRSRSRYRDRLYAVWSDLVDDQWRLRFTYSADRGRSWAAPRPVSPAAPRTAAQWQQAIAVNDAGVVGILWYDTRHAPTGDGFDVYFTASVDGGATFLPEVKVSSASSRPNTARNATPVAASYSGRTDSTGSFVALMSPFARFAGGGDYIGMSVGAGGVFHPFWADSRTGAYQAWTARVRVDRGEDHRAPAEALMGIAPPVRLDGKVATITDPVLPSDEANVIIVPVRLRNVSQDTLWGPFTVEITYFGAEDDARFELEKYAEPTRVLNADNGERGRGAAFRYEHAAALPPAAVTEARSWRFRVAGPRQSAISFKASVRGYAGPAAMARP